MPTGSILVIHQGALGDVVLCFSAIASVKREKDVSLAILCQGEVGKIARKLKIADTHFSLESARFCSLFSKAVSRDMRSFINDYETVVFIGSSADIGDQIGRVHNAQTYRITPRPPAEESTHVSAHIMKQLQAVGLLKKTSNCWDVLGPPGAMRKRSQAEFKMRVSSSCQPIVRHIPKVPQENVFLIHPGAGSQRKRWALESFVEVSAAIRKMRIGEVVFVIGPAESDLAPLVRRRVGKRFRVRQFEDLTEVVAFMKAANCFIGNDSGLTHLSAFMGIPTVAIFGPANPSRWSPIGTAIKVLRGRVDCSPCFEVEEANCCDPRCLSGVSVGMVLGGVRELAFSTAGAGKECGRSRINCSTGLDGGDRA